MESWGCLWLWLSVVQNRKKREICHLPILWWDVLKSCRNTVNNQFAHRFEFRLVVNCCHSVKTVKESNEFPLHIVVVMCLLLLVSNSGTIDMWWAFQEFLVGLASVVINIPRCHKSACMNVVFYPWRMLVLECAVIRATTMAFANLKQV